MGVKFPKTAYRKFWMAPKIYFLNSYRRIYRLHLCPRPVARYYVQNGPGRVRPGDRLGLSRSESVEVARLRTGHSYYSEQSDIASA